MFDMESSHNGIRGSLAIASACLSYCFSVWGDTTDRFHKSNMGVDLKSLNKLYFHDASVVENFARGFLMAPGMVFVDDFEGDLMLAVSAASPVLISVIRGWRHVSHSVAKMTLLVRSEDHWRMPKTTVAFQKLC